MRIAIAVALLATGLKPPVIHEPFTPLPCPKHASTTLALEGCAEQHILAGDRKIDARAHAIFFKLAPGERAGFVRGEHEWLAYRRDTCAAESSKYAGGTLAPVVDAQCEIARNATHLTDLGELLKSLSSP